MKNYTVCERKKNYKYKNLNIKFYEIFILFYKVINALTWRLFRHYSTWLSGLLLLSDSFHVTRDTFAETQNNN